MAKAKTQTVYRDADTGQFVTKKQAEKHPKTTVKETNKTTGGKKKGK